MFKGIIKMVSQRDASIQSELFLIHNFSCLDLYIKSTPYPGRFLVTQGNNKTLAWEWENGLPAVAKLQFLAYLMVRNGKDFLGQTETGECLFG